MEIKKGSFVKWKGERFYYDSMSVLREGLVIVENNNGEFFHVDESELEQWDSFKEDTIKFECFFENLYDLKTTFTPSPEAYADIKEKEIEEMDMRAFANSVLAKAKKDANHWYKNIKDRL